MDDVYVAVPLELSFLRKLPTFGGWVTSISGVNLIDNLYNKLDVVYIYNEMVARSNLEKFYSYIGKQHGVKRETKKNPLTIEKMMEFQKRMVTLTILKRSGKISAMT